MEHAEPIDDFKLTDPHFFAHGDPHGLWKRLRDEDPIRWTQSRLGRNFWSVTRHADVQRVLGDNAAFSSNRYGPSLPTNPDLIDASKSEHARLQQKGAMLNSMDPPNHAGMRAQMMGRFTPKRVQELETDIRLAATTILDEAMARDAFDFVGDVAARLPLTVIFNIMGVPQADWPMLFRYSNMHTAPEDPAFSVGSAIETRQAAIKGTFEYCRDLALERRKNPGEDLLSMLGQIRDHEGRLLDDDALGANGHMFVIAGQETTRNSLSAGMLELIRAPAEFERLRQDRTLLKTVPDEFIRWANPVAHLLRTATADVEIEGKQIHAGDWVVSWIASANRDERAFPDPFRFDVGRAPNPHVGLGYGPHFCIGAFLARAEIRAMMDLILDRIEAMELTGPPQLVTSIQFCGLKALPVSIRRLREAV